MDSENEIEIVDQNSDISDDIDYEPISKRPKRTCTTTKYYGNRTSTSYDGFFNNLESFKSNEVHSISEENIVVLSGSNDLKNISEENIDRTSRSYDDENISRENIDQFAFCKQLEHSIMTKLSSFESKLLLVIDSKLESYDNAIKVLQTQVARIECKLNQRRSSCVEMNDNESYITELQSLGFPLDSIDKVNQLEINLSIEKYQEKLVRWYFYYQKSLMYV